MYKGTDNKTVISNVGVIILTILCATAAWIGFAVKFIFTLIANA